ncbi:double zinc ribbon domain-containing protein [Psychrobacter sp. GP33]|uniref:double zinc ribbon domain-containing protein n=1 Tax=Psychrobacter sp. GP33 TaxID=2758709 RepID=UPI0015F97498|nr:zinc ribbon domain-containing protein [Psychrobacter sp. GP33]
MAIINCPECTHKISDQSVACTNCGFPTSKMKFLIKCPECSKSISNQSVSCTTCGFPLVKPAVFNNTPFSSSELKELEEVDEHEEYGFFNNTNMFIIGCIIIYFISKEEIHYILQHVIDQFSR